MADSVRRFRKKPVVIEAMQWSGTSLAADIFAATYETAEDEP